MSTRDYIVMLYDFYGELFSDKQKKYFEEYYFQNLSLGEIGLNFGVSRNAIHKVIHGVEEKLKFYEEKLGLFRKNQIICDIIQEEKDEKLKKKLEGLILGDEICE
ncbi:MAG: hypothetical protein MR598_04995 [Erysipelotrichaceae bacterium]|nr:hypothetical protein [Erysipelotrichaceae bacterium]